MYGRPSKINGAIVKTRGGLHTHAQAFSATHFGIYFRDIENIDAHRAQTIAALW